MVMKSHEKTWNLKIHFPVLDKSWILGENGRSHDVVVFENWKNSLSHRAKLCLQKAGFCISESSKI